MPAVEIASFTATKAFLSDVSTAVFDKAIDAVKEIDGCSSVYRGFQHDDKTRAYVLIVWGSYETYVNATKSEGLSVLKVESNKLGLSFDDISIQLVALDDDPSPLLDAPLTDLWFSQPKLGHTDADLSSFIWSFVAQVNNDEYTDLQFADLPVWAFAVNKQNIGLNVYFGGWKGIEARKILFNNISYANFLKGVYEFSSFNIKGLFLTKA
ncbi:hypothetical protein CPB84DRAFT_1785076 [Gymnopilus junonius]|uniref:ABM domain-containing protein n=1 Tax=Gymnopilus junonius TaxID=109634 RepID=A0A9P5TL71_GYMJU|nr:hypothetical protein CPB84DRAFT_1785076 [Gymnopilus junonius]